jgi:Fe-S oxidoreductase
MNIEIENLKEDVKETVEKCFKCGLCKENCPVLRVIREEQFSARGKAIILENNIYDKVVYDCSLCKSCEKKCPLKLKLCDSFIKTRRILVLQEKELSANKEMINNLNLSENIYGILERKEE